MIRIAAALLFVLATATAAQDDPPPSSAERIREAMERAAGAPGPCLVSTEQESTMHLDASVREERAQDHAQARNGIEIRNRGCPSVDKRKAAVTPVGR